MTEAKKCSATCTPTYIVSDRIASISAYKVFSILLTWKEVPHNLLHFLLSFFARHDSPILHMPQHRPCRHLSPSLRPRRRSNNRHYWCRIYDSRCRSKLWLWLGVPWVFMLIRHHPRFMIHGFALEDNHPLHRCFLTPLPPLPLLRGDLPSRSLFKCNDFPLPFDVPIRACIISRLGQLLDLPLGFVWHLEDLFLELGLVHCVGGITAAFCSQALDFRGAGREGFDVVACWFMAVVAEPLDAENIAAVFEFLLCFVAAQEPDFLEGVVDDRYA